MKNIILVSPQSKLRDIKRDLISKILDAGYHIVLLIVSMLEDKRDYENIQGIDKVMTLVEIEEIESLDLIDYDVIQQCRVAQFNYEIFSTRFQNDHAMIKFSYYTALNFWLRVFDENRIDFVINTQMIHGRLDDVILWSVANMKRVKMFFFEEIGYNNSHCINYNGKLCPVYCESENTLDDILQPEKDKRFVQSTSVQKIEKGKFYQLLYTVGGNLLEDFTRRLIHWNWKPRSIHRQKSKAFWSDKFLGYIKLKRIEHHLNRLSNRFNKAENYIFYALHFEPEATIEVRVILENQLAIIKMLSDVLPYGWKLYVKEHPSQFNLNNDGGYGYLISVPRFKSREFYDKIAGFKNVRIVSTNTQSDELINNSKAVASIVGTVFFEAIQKLKPILAFSDLNPVIFSKDVFSIHSYDECQKAVDKIAQGFKPKYDDINSVLKHYTLTKYELGKNIVKLLQAEC